MREACQRPARRRAQPLVRGLAPRLQPRRKPAQSAVAHRDGNIALKPKNPARRTGEPLN